MARLPLDLDLAARGRRGGYGQVPHAAVMSIGRDGGLDPSQYRAVLQLAGGGDVLSVLTAPAGAGKTSTLGAAAQAWQDAGYRMVGLAPSARAAAELAAATGERAGHAGQVAAHPPQHHRGEPGTTALDSRTALIGSGQRRRTGIEPARTGYRPSPVLKTGTASGTPSPLIRPHAT